MVVVNVKKLIPASRAELFDIVNTRGEDLGQVQTFMFDPETNRIAFVIVSFGGILGLTDKWLAIPAEVLRWDTLNKKFILEVPRETLEKAKGLDKGKWPEEVDLSWMEEVYTCFGCRPYWVSEAMWVERDRRMETAIASSSWLKDHSLIYRSNAHAGKIHDLIIDLQSGYIAYAAVDTAEGIMQSGKIVVPLQSIELQKDGELILDLDDTQIAKSPVFDEHRIHLDEGSLRAIYGFYGFSPYWENREIWQRRSHQGRIPEPAFSYRPDLYRISALTGTAVRDLQGNELGKLDDFMIDLDSGFLASAILADGGFLDVGDRLSPVPLEVLSFDPVNKVFYLSADRQTIKEAPAFDKSRLPLVDRRGLTDIYAAYGYTPYWRGARRQEQVKQTE